VPYHTEHLIELRYLYLDRVALEQLLSLQVDNQSQEPEAGSDGTGAQDRVAKINEFVSMRLTLQDVKTEIEAVKAMKEKQSQEAQEPQEGVSGSAAATAATAAETTSRSTVKPVAVSSAASSVSKFEFHRRQRPIPHQTSCPGSNNDEAMGVPPRCDVHSPAS
jgi:hypothetical protein